MELNRIAEQVVDKLKKQGSRIVLAESCTGGLVAAALTSVPGVSECFCGSLVVYRDATKVQWLDVQHHELEAYSSVSLQCSRALVRRSLEKTTEADVAFSITGHLGPDVEKDLDGICYLAFLSKADSDPHLDEPIFFERSISLSERSRSRRQEEAAAISLRWIAECLDHA